MNRANFVKPSLVVALLISHDIERIEETAEVIIRTRYIVKIQPNEMPVMKNFGKMSKPIPAEKYRNSIYTVYRRTLPMFSKKEIEQMTDETMKLSAQMAASIFSDKAQGSFAQLGYQNNTQALDTHGIIR